MDEGTGVGTESLEEMEEFDCATWIHRSANHGVFLGRGVRLFGEPGSEYLLWNARDKYRLRDIFRVIREGYFCLPNHRIDSDGSSMWPVAGLLS